MSVMDKLINAMKYNEDDDYIDGEDLDEDEGFYDEEGDAEEPAPRSTARAAAAEEYEEETPAPAPRARARAAAPADTDTRETRRNRRERASEPAAEERPAGRSRRPERPRFEQNGEVCIIKPTSVNDAREVTDTLLANCTVVLNLEGLDVDVAQRIIDFTSGSCYAVDGNVMKISHYIFVITPANIGVSGDISTSTRDGLDHTPGSSLNMPFGR